jgi:Spy/CpxP family protein refolding chaperone
MLMFSRRLIASTALALAFALGASPALADGGNTGNADGPRQGPEHGKRGHRKGHHGDFDQQFPMKADAFREIVDRRLAKAESRMDKMFEAHKVPEAVRALVKKDFADGATLVRALAAKVSTDGTVTRDEGHEVRKLAMDLKQQAKAKYGLGGKREHKRAQR